jgi:ankyrin repeat protein
MAPTLIIQQLSLQDANGNTHFMNLIITQNNDEVMRILNVLKTMSEKHTKHTLVNNLNLVNRNGENSLILAIKYGTDEMVSKIFSLFDEEEQEDYETLTDAIDQKDIDGNNALMCAIISGKFKHISKLVEETANTGDLRNHVNRNGDTALLLALKSNAPNHATISRLLIGNARRVHDYDLPDRRGNTAKNLMTDDLKELALIPISIGGKSRKNKQKKRKSTKKKSVKRRKRSRKH